MVDGIILCSLVSKFRDDFKIITHEVLRFTNKIDKYILPIYFNKDQKKSFSVNLLTHKKDKEFFSSSITHFQQYLNDLSLYLNSLYSVLD